MPDRTDKLLNVMARLRDPERGCEWDVRQTFASIAPCTIEEAYEVADAIARNDTDDLKDELGDLLLQVVFHSRIAEEQELFGYPDVVEAITAKLIRRHPHVFGPAEQIRLPGAAGGAADPPPEWEQVKEQERARRQADRDDGPPSALDGVARALPALLRAEKLSRRAARAGFDWPDMGSLWAKLEEELGELRHEITNQAPAWRLREELGDLLFCVVNLARFLKLNPEQTLAEANDKFSRRFQVMEALAAESGQPLETLTAERQEQLWQQAKARLAEADGE